MYFYQSYVLHYNNIYTQLSHLHKCIKIYRFSIMGNKLTVLRFINVYTVGGNIAHRSEVRLQQHFLLCVGRGEVGELDHVGVAGHRRDVALVGGGHLQLGLRLAVTPLPSNIQCVVSSLNTMELTTCFQHLQTIIICCAISVNAKV